MLALSLVLLTGTAHAAPGDLDPSYSGDGWRTIDFGGWQERGHAVAIEPNGSILVAGRSSHNGSLESSNFALARSSPNGGSFFGRITDFGGYEEANGVALQRFGGKIVVSGFSFEPGQARKFATARYNPDLQPDPEFAGIGRGLTEFPGLDAVSLGVAVYPAPDYRIVEVGRAGNDFALARHRATDGTLDPDLGGGMRTTDLGEIDHAHAVAIDAFGRIVVAGITGPPGDADFAVARYRGIDGSLDKPGFGPDGYRETDLGSAGDAANAVAIQPDGKIVLAGVTSSMSSDFALARYNDDGSLDTTFSGDGKLTTDFAGDHDIGNGVAVQPDGRIVVAGYSFSSTTNNDFAVARYNPDGTLDTSFSGDGKQTSDLGSNDVATSIALQPDGKIVLAGYSEPGELDGNFAIARYQGGGAAPPAVPPVAAATSQTPLTHSRSRRLRLAAGVNTTGTAGAGRLQRHAGPGHVPRPRGQRPPARRPGRRPAVRRGGQRHGRRRGRLRPALRRLLPRGEARGGGGGGQRRRPRRRGQRPPRRRGRQRPAQRRGAPTAGRGAGHDKLTGGAGNDRLSGGAGKDTLDRRRRPQPLLRRRRQRQGERRQRQARPRRLRRRPRDSARVDRVDRVKGCERVRRR